MPQHDKRIPENARCSTCSGAGWTWWSSPETADTAEQAKWIICRECLGTGRTDKNGRKRQKPDDPSDG
jgi:DnaJ-class molecular chaperone